MRSRLIAIAAFVGLFGVLHVHTRLSSGAPPIVADVEECSQFRVGGGHHRRCLDYAMCDGYGYADTDNDVCVPYETIQVPGHQVAVNL